jgi:nucleoside-diphosphate-sugar epimerase
MSQDTSLVIVGGNGPAGFYFMQRLAAAGLKADVVTRRSISVPAGFTVSAVDLSGSTNWAAPKGAVVISFLPLWILADFLPRFSGAKAVIATGSTSRFSKAHSSDAHERSISAKLEKAETALRDWAEKNGAQWTVLRPTIIYDCKNDKNITRMARFIRRWHFLPLAAPAAGLRRPIHTDDVAKAAFKCLDNPEAANKAFNISGGEVLSYRAMAERVFMALGQKPRFIMLPCRLLQATFKSAERCGLIKVSGFGAAVFQRMNEDLVFDTAEGIQILDYQPRMFNPEFTDV